MMVESICRAIVPSLGDFSINTLMFHWIMEKIVGVEVSVFHPAPASLPRPKCRKCSKPAVGCDLCGSCCDIMHEKMIPCRF